MERKTTGGRGGKMEIKNRRNRRRMGGSGNARRRGKGETWRRKEGIVNEARVKMT